MAVLPGGGGLFKHNTPTIHCAFFCTDYVVCIILCVKFQASARGADEAITLQGCYATYFGSSLRMFRDSISVPSWRVKKSKKNKWCALPLKMLPTGCLETSLNNPQRTLRKNPERRRPHPLCDLTQFLNIL
jgi:hypothetical protein